MATGNYVTMPGNLYPGKAMAADVLSAVAGLVANVIELSEADKDPRVAFIKKMYLEALKDLAEVIPTIQNKNVWSAFIEVYDSNDPNDKYWIEVRGFRMPGDNTACWTPGGGYESWGQAADAGGSLAKWALDNGGAIPEYVPPGWFAPDWDGRSPYITGVPRKASSQFLNAINTTNKLIDKVQEIKDKIDKIIKED